MAEGGKKEDTPSKTVTVVEQKSDKKRVVLKLTRSANDTERKVQWEEATVDNEFMNKKKSKCCCIYTKPRAFGESDSESDGEDGACTHHCRGHCTKDYRNNETVETVTEIENPANKPPPDPVNDPNDQPPGT